jgi:hypothetical protein
MSSKGRAGRQGWQARREVFADELADRIAASAADRMRVWSDRGRVPRWVRVKARLRGRRLESGDRSGAR